jgi:hypothetical protein
LISGILYLKGNFYPSHLLNTSFKNISDPSLYTDGGVLYVSSLSYMNLTIDRCIFSSCRGYYGGVIYLDYFSPWIIINRSRFEENEATFGNDIYSSNSSCFSPNTISNSCTTSVLKDTYCLLSTISKILKPCYKDIVL